MSDQDATAVMRREEESPGREIEVSGGRFDIAQVDQPTAALKKAESLVSYMAEKCTGPEYIADIQGKQYPRCDWWTTVGAGLGLFPREESCRKLDRTGVVAYEATVGVYNGDQCVTRASAICSSEEPTWDGRDEYAVRSMAITRATGKAYRIGLSFLAVMADLEPTPAEEMQGQANGTPQSTDGPTCPDCGSDCWDNSDDPKAAANGGKRPNYKCKDRDCDWASWDSDPPGSETTKGPDPEKIRDQAKQRLKAEVAKHFSDPDSIGPFVNLLVGYRHENDDAPAGPADWTTEDLDAAREALVDGGEEYVADVQAWGVRQENG